MTFPPPSVTRDLSSASDAALTPLRDLVRDLRDGSRASSTRRAYTSAWRRFERWAQGVGAVAIPAAPEVVALYLASLVADTRALGTISRALVAIGQVHLDRGLRSPADDPDVRRVVKGIRRRLGATTTPKTALLSHDIQRMVTGLGDDARAIRDRALLLVGFASGLRRSEIASLDVEDLSFVEQGMVVTLRRSKTDQDAVGRRLGIAHGSGEILCAVLALQVWLERAQLANGAVFRAITRGGRITERRANERTVARVVKSAALRVGLDPKLYAAHSLRSGCATSMGAAGESDRAIMRRLGHRTVTMTYRYTRDVALFDTTPSARSPIQTSRLER